MATDDLQFITSRVAYARGRAAASRSCTVGRAPSPEFECFEVFDNEVIDLTLDDTDRRTGHRILHEGELALQRLRLRYDRGFVQAGDFVEVENISLGKHEIEFVKVQIVLENVPMGRKLLRGIPYVRTRSLMGSLPKKANEVCQILHFDTQRQSEDGAQYPLLVEASVSQIVGKTKLVTTNAIYPKHSAASIGDSALVCRWQFKVFFVIVGRRTRPEAEALERIQVEDSDRAYRVDEASSCAQWRGGRIKGGSWSANVELDSPGRSNIRSISQKYTLFDSFAGAGGVSRGAQSAGFKVQYAVDQASEVWDTYRANFPDTKLYRMSVDKFIQTSQRQTRVDVLHLSPPCQYFSPAHTHESVNDEANIFALFGCNELINRTRPRIITLEQTFGLTHDRHRQYFQALLGDMTQFGYSVRWKVVRLCTWGSAQDRKRLIVIAAAPGERLPPFPAATHGESLKPFVTIKDAISEVKTGDNLHDIDRVMFERPRPSYSADRLALTITTNASECYHPSGRRAFTMREFASLQGFPKTHRFRGNKTAIKRQIGNAFPPNTVKVLYKHIETWLLQQDGMRQYEPESDDIVMVDDDSDDSGFSDNSLLFHSARPSPAMYDVMEIDDDDDYYDKVGREVIDLT